MSLSPDARSLSGQSAITLGAGDFGGGLIKENCTLKAGSGSPWSYTNQTIILMSNTSTTATPFGYGVSGLVGLGTLKTPTNATGFNANFGDSIYGQDYIRNPDAANFTFISCPLFPYPRRIPTTPRTIAYEGPPGHDLSPVSNVDIRNTYSSIPPRA